MSDVSRAVLVDEYGELCRQVAAFKPKRDRHEELGKLIRSWFDASGAADSFAVAGQAYTVQVSARKEERRIVALPKVQRRLGMAAFLQIASVPFKLLDALIHPDEQARMRLVEKVRTGPRTIEAVAIAPAGKEAA